MMRPALLLAACLAAGALSGCSNDCQTLCNEMGKYWQDCGLPFGDAEVADCKKSFRDQLNNKEDDFDTYRATCRQLTSVEENDDGDRMIALRARFTCDDMEAGPGGAFGGTE
ncbi:MAG: hypothetical protein GY898_05830 [Proteobacteria bacterium]|nr:hypothetical protein [Pseudomonadota bacterium]